MTDAVATAGTVLADVPAPGVYRLRIDNHLQRNALTASVMAGLLKAIAGVSPTVRCLLLTASGTTFSAGYDLQALATPPDPSQLEATIAPDRVALLALLDSQPLPVVAALNGPALGGGLELALACDVRLAVPRASLGAPAGRLGLVYSPGGLERILSEVPFAVAADLFLTGSTLTAQRAYELGLVSRIVQTDELDQMAVATAVRVAELAPLSARAHRVALRDLRRSEGKLEPAEHERLRLARRDALRSRDIAEGIAAFKERRPARFSGC